MTATTDSDRGGRPGRRLTLRALALALVLAPVVVDAGPAAATPPGGNGALVFNRGGNIWVSAWDGTGARALTTWPGGGAGWPKWSPDGSRISYTRGGAVWTMRADGTGHTRLFPGTQASWSRDGRSMAYSDGDSVEVRRLPAGPAQTVEFYADSGGCPWERRPGPSTSWTADGKLLFGVVENGGSSDLCGDIPSLTAVQKAAPVQTGQSPAGTALTTWKVAGSAPTLDAAPRGTGYVVATSAGSRDGLARLYVGSATTPRRQLTTDRGVHAPVFSPDGRSVLYTQHLPGGPWIVRRVPLDGSRPPVTVLGQGSQADVRPR